MKRRTLLAAGAALPGAMQAAPAAGEPDGKTLRLAFASAETTFDPPQTNSDANASAVLAQILEAPLGFDYLARPVRLSRVTAAAMPAVSADGRVFTARSRSSLRPSGLSDSKRYRSAEFQRGSKKRLMAYT